MPQFVEQQWIPQDGYGLSRRAKQGGTYFAFLPDPISHAQLTISSNLSQKAAAVERRIIDLVRSSEVVGLEGISRFLLRSEAVASSKIEGIAPRADKIALAELGQHEEIQGISSQAELVANNIKVLRTASDQLARESITVADLCELQFQLLENPRIAGLRQEQNWIGGSDFSPIGADFVPPPPAEVATLLDDLVDYLNGAAHGGLLQAAIVHAQFETIHPFVDGNGRVGRALIHTVLRRRGLTQSAILPISAVFATWSKSYVEGLTAFREGDLEGWFAFFVEATNIAVEEASRMSLEIDQLRNQWFEQYQAQRAGRGIIRPLRSDSAESRILNGLSNLPVLTAKTAEREYGVSSTAANRALEDLADAGILSSRSVGKKGNRGYLAHELLDILTLTDRRLASTQFDTKASAPIRPAPHIPPGSR